MTTLAGLLLALAGVGCTAHYRVATIPAPAEEALAKLDADAKAAGFGASAPGRPRVYTRDTKTYDRSSLTYVVRTDEVRATVVARSASESRVIVEGKSVDAMRAVLADPSAIEATDYAATERDVYPGMPDILHFSPYFNYTVGKSPTERNLDHRYYFGAFIALAVATWGDTLAFEPSHRRRLWLGAGGDAGLSVGDDPTWRGYFAVHFQHGDVRSLDGRVKIQSSPSYSYQLAFSMLRLEAPARSEVMLVAPMAAMGLVAQVGWNWASERAVAWSVGVRLPLPLGFGVPTGPVHVPSISPAGGQ